MVFQAKRPWSGEQTRYHAGVDVRATKGLPILAPEDLVIVAVDRGWEGTAKATLVHTTSGKSILFGCTAPGTAPPVGTLIKAGSEVARVGVYPKGSSMVHFQLYDAKISPSEANKWQSWKFGTAKPPHLSDPMPYLLGAHEEPPKKPETETSTGRTDVDPCPRIDGQLVCMLPDVAAWTETARNEITLTKAVLATLLAAPDDLWTEAANSADAKFANDADFVLLAEDQGETANLGANERVLRLVAAVKVARDCRQVFQQALNKKPGRKPSGGGGGGGMIGALIGLGVVGGGIGLAVARGRRKNRK
ncbi:hypothetical protein [Nannocystis pusilla]|uniref:hypothetical protein n=1 Tax=Nannocystis pusilla TaxID=889268 RepID=UPI003B7FAE1F